MLVALHPFSLAQLSILKKAQIMLLSVDTHKRTMMVVLLLLTFCMQSALAQTNAKAIKQI